MTKYRAAIRYGVAVTAALLAAATAFAGPVEDARQAFKSHDYAAAAKYAEQATQEQPENPAGYMFLGSSRAKLGDKSGAREAWGKVISLDPDLATVRDKQGFLNAYRSVGGDPPALPSSSGASSSGSGGGLSANAGSEVIRSLAETNTYVSSDLKGEVDEGALQQAASENRKLVAVSTIYPYNSPKEMAAKLREALNLGEGVVVVATPKRIGASSGRLSPDQIDQSLQQAGLDQAYAQGGLTAALIKAGDAVSGEVSSDRRTDTGRSSSLLFLSLAGVGGFLVLRSLNKKKAMDAVRIPLLKLHRETLDNLSYADNYLDLLPAGAAAEHARALRAAAYERFSIAGEVLKTARTPEDARKAEPLLREALSQMQECRANIDKATGGTGVAMSLPTIPSLATDAEKARDYLKSVEQVQSEQERDRFQQEVDSIPPDQRGVSFFSGRPMPASALVPVTMVVQGHKRTVMATQEEAAAIARGETPPVRAFDNGEGQYIPWYENRNYNPYRDYYGGWGYGGSGGLGTLVDLYLLTHVFGGGIWGGWGGWGYGVPYGGPVIINNNDYYSGGYGDGSYSSDNGIAGGGDAPVDNAGGFDFFGQQDYNDTAAPDAGSFDGGSFDSGDSGSFDSGSFDSGGSDFGGGDFGGGGGGDW